MDGGANRNVKLRELFPGDNMPFDKSLYNGPNTLINDHLSQDQHWQGNQESYVSLDIAKEGKLHSSHTVGLRQR
jgi:hypothetical protein